MRCELETLVEHSNIREQFRQALIPCPLMEKRETGMFSLGVVCGGCCIRLQMFVEAKSDLLLRSVVSVEDYKRNPDVIAEHLPEHLKQYYIALRKRGKTVKDVAEECSRCKPSPIGDKHTKAEGQEMTQCGGADLR